LFHSHIAAGDFVEISDLFFPDTCGAYRSVRGARQEIKTMQLFRTSTLIFSGMLACVQTQATELSHPEIMLITAARTPLERVHAGNATTVITREQIERQQARYVTDLLRAVPGFSVSESGARGSQTQVRVRGAEGNHVLVLVDGIRANDPANSDEFRWELLSAYNVEKIEIIRGPQSALWGSDALAAVVYIDTIPDSDVTQFNGFAESGTESTLNTGFNGSTSGDAWSLSYGASQLNTDGTNTSRTGTEDDGSDLTTASLNGTLQATESLSFNAGIRAVDASSDFDSISFATGLPEDADLISDSKNLFLQSGVELDTFDGRIAHRLDLRLLETERDDLTDGLETSSSESDRTTISYQTTMQLDVNVLTLAAEHERSTFTQRGELINLGMGVILDPNQDQSMTVNSAIADFQWNITDNITALSSARYDDFSDFDDAVTGRFSLSYRLSDTTKLRAAVGTGQKNPTFTERFGFFPGSFVGNPNLKLEKSTAYEFGIEQLLLEDSLEIELTYFNQNLKDEINGYAFLPGQLDPTAINIPGDSERKGVEFATLYDITNNLQTGATYTYTDSTSEPTPGIDVREVRRPANIGSIHGNYRLADNRANLFLVADYNGSQLDNFFPPFPQSPTTVKLPSYWLVSFTASYDMTDTINLYTRVTNLLDEDYEEIIGFQAPGLGAYAGFRINFGG
jgi:vitamin B12 transporter